jgi:hypothetical protein
MAKTIRYVSLVLAGACATHYIVPAVAKPMKDHEQGKPPRAALNIAVPSSTSGVAVQTFIFDYINGQERR